MIIAIDYDGTFSADPALFSALIVEMRRYGHEPIIVTGRPEAWASDIHAAIGDSMPIICCENGQWKREAALEAGYSPDIFIDDCPEYVAQQYTILSKHGSRMLPSGLLLFMAFLAKVWRSLRG